jgi:glycosyltransferase involved in cell wall biosynthesis
MRYVWDMYHDYLGTVRGPVARAVFRLSAHYMRLWDLATASRVDYFIANSHNVARRIRKHYRRDAAVIHCPANISAGYLTSEIGDYYLVVGRLVDYKRVDLAVEACSRLKRPLKVIGDGPQYNALRRMAGPTVEFLGFASKQLVHQSYAGCRALLFPGEEDFGLVPVEAQAFGRPVIAYGAGGALETVNGLYPGEPFASAATGVFFREQSAESLVDAIRYFEAMESQFSPETIREHSAAFDEAHFRAAFENFVASKWAEFQDAGFRRAKNVEIATGRCI